MYPVGIYDGRCVGAMISSPLGNMYGSVLVIQVRTFIGS